MISRAQKNIFLLVLFNFILISNSAKYPSDLPRCKPDDDDCIIQATQAVINKVIGNTGLKSLSIPSIEPLQVNQIDIKQGSDSPVNIELILKNIEVTGLAGLQFTKITGFSKEPSGKYEIHLKAPSINLFGDYTVDGKVLILPIVGDGKCNLTVVNPTAILKFTGKSITRNGKEYLDANNFKLSLTTTRLYIYLSNLYKGDKALGDSTNAFLNDNWQDIFNELKTNIADAFSQVFGQIISGLFNRFPYNDLILQD